VTDYQAIYAERAEAYDRMVSAEDCDGNLAPALAAVAPLAGARVLEVGAGTGRLTRLLLDAGATVDAFERAPAMLVVARRRLGDRPALRLDEADARRLPIEDASYDLAVAGWVFGHLTHWESDWRTEIGRGLAEMRRAVRPGGAIAIIETLGTGTAEPGPPNDGLATFYGWLEEDGFQRRTVRTDYAFDDAEQAALATAFFFGDAFADRIRAIGSPRIVEHTGIWFKSI
jgi:ubiquinone/menaquinone biosynthesis C-methylase UbiE